VSVVAYNRFRFLWGAVDWQSGTGNPYATSQTGTLGADAVSGVAARRAVMQISRNPASDPAVMHFDFLNMTSSAPDDSWTTGDFTTLEALLDTYWGSLKTKINPSYSLTQISWYRVGPGVVPPNPAVRTVTRAVAGTAASQELPPQVACSITFRTASRRSWGRTYVPIGALSAGGDIVAGRFSNAYVDAMATYVNTLVTGAAAADFHLVVYSATKHALLNVETVEADNVADVVRRRRWKASTYKKLLP
jgi:hypothetical protein